MSSNDPLPSWKEGAAKTAILQFVRSVREPGESFVLASERVAAFDNDGTLWCEKPLYIQADFMLRRLAEMARENPALASEQPWKAVVENDREWLAGMLDHVPELIRGVTAAYDAITTDAFEEAVRAFFATAKHPTLGVPYTSLRTSQPARNLDDRQTLLIAVVARERGRTAAGFNAISCSSAALHCRRPLAVQHGTAPRTFQLPAAPPRARR